jgi:hypothetical protein
VIHHPQQVAFNPSPGHVGVVPTPSPPVLSICDSSSTEVLKLLGKKNNDDLIDLTLFGDTGGSPSSSAKRRTRASVLAVFDPLNSSNDEEDDDEEEVDEAEDRGRAGAAPEADDDWTYFETYDPFQFMYEQSSRSDRSETYAPASYCAIAVCPGESRKALARCIRRLQIK